MLCVLGGSHTARRCLLLAGALFVEPATRRLCSGQPFGSGQPVGGEVSSRGAPRGRCSNGLESQRAGSDMIQVTAEALAGTHAAA
jgi:hypothetical protein